MLEGMPVVASALAYRRLVAESAALRLLRADLVAPAAALLTAHLGAPGSRISADELHERLDADLDELRDHFDLGAKSAKAFCDDWRGAGLLIRRPAPDARGETYELSPEARDAVRVLDQLAAPQTTITESRLVAVMAAVHRLAVDTDTDVGTRLAALTQERDRIDAEIQRLSTGDVDVLDERRATERMNDILLQVQGLPADFARVRARFDELNHDLRARILNEDAVPGDVLDDIFRGVDLIESSDEGRTFSGFSSLLREPERSSQLDFDISAILDRDFAGTLDPSARRSLRGLVKDLKRGSREVHGVLAEFARSLRRYVYSQDFQQDRALRTALQGALAAAVPAVRHTKPYRETGLHLELPTMRLSSVGEITAHDPSEFDAGETLPDAPSHAVDFAELARLARETEIDYGELTRDINDVLSTRESATVGDVLDAHPATQGLASVVGLLSLAARYGRVRDDASETVAWSGAADGVTRSATLATHVFDAEVEA